MTGADELRKRREEEALRIRTALNRQRGEQRANTKGGEGTVAFVEERKCIGCDQCTIVCDDDAIELYHVDVCLLYTSPSPRDQRGSRMPSSA